jgi:hypothetical protein
MRRYWIQNDPQNFESILTKFIIRLTKRGHNLHDLLPLLKHAAVQLENHHNQQRHNDKPNTLYIHQRYHPNGLQRTDIRALYNATLKPYLDYDTMTVAISRPHNLREVLTKTSLLKPPSLDIQNLIEMTRGHNN